MKRDPTNRNLAKRSIRMRMPHAWIGLVVLIGISIGITGCSMFKLEPENSKSDILKNAFSKAKDRVTLTGSDKLSADKASEKVRLAGGLDLGDTDNLAFTPEVLAELLNEQIEAEKWNTVRGLIRTYPDVVTKLMMGANGGLPPASLRTIAKLFDHQWTSNGNSDWQELVASRRKSGSDDFLEKRSQFLALLENNEIDAALKLQLSRNLTSSDPLIARAESLRLEGIAQLMQGNHRESTKRLGQSFQLLEESQPYIASQIGLLLGEAQRHADEMDAWKSSWKSATEIQSRLLAEKGLCDPAFWSKAAFLRPVATQWQPSVIRRLEHSLRDENLEFGSNSANASEAVVWAIVGTQSLKRHESQNAILAFKKSEAMVSDSSLKEELQMQQALAMIDSGQQGPASAILIRLGSKPNLLGDRSKAILATLKLQNGSLAQGMNLLQSAIKTSNQWPTSERLRAQADYGLAYLMRGREEQGIALLNQVYDEFVKEQSYDHAAQCLANIATYYEKTDQPANHRTAVARIKQLELY